MYLSQTKTSSRDDRTSNAQFNSDLVNRTGTPSTISYETFQTKIPGRIIEISASQSCMASVSQPPSFQSAGRYTTAGSLAPVRINQLPVFLIRSPIFPGKFRAMGCGTVPSACRKLICNSPCIEPPWLDLVFLQGSRLSSLTVSLRQYGTKASLSCLWINFSWSTAEPVPASILVK